MGAEPSDTPLRYEDIMLRLITLRVLESYFRRPFLSLLPLILLTIAGVVHIMTKAPEYITAGGISVRDEQGVTDVALDFGGGGLNWGETPSEKAISEFNELMASDSFVNAIMVNTDYVYELDDPDVDEIDVYDHIRETVWADKIGDNNFGIFGRADDPVLAQQAVQATIDAFFNFNINTGVRQKQNEVAFWTERYNEEKAEYEGAQAELTAYSAANPKPVRGEEDPVVALEKERLQAVANSAAERYEKARDTLDLATLAFRDEQTATADKYLILDSPSVPEKPTTSLSSNIVVLGIFMAIGALMGIIGVVGGAFLDRSFRYPVDVKESLELPVLGAIPTGEEFVSRHFQDMGQSVAAAPPPTYRTKLTPNVEPPTLIIMPGEKAELERIAIERKEADGQVDLVGSFG